MKSFRSVVYMLLAYALVACVSLGVPPADTFNKKLVAGYATVQTVADSTRALLTAGKLTPADAQRVQTTNAQALAALDAAAVVAPTDLAGADNRLAATIMILTSLQAYLATHGATK